MRKSIELRRMTSLKFQSSRKNEMDYSKEHKAHGNKIKCQTV